MSEYLVSDNVSILVVDEDSRCRLLPGLILRPFGFVVHEARSVQDAVAILIQNHFGIVMVGDVRVGRNDFLKYIRGGVSNRINVIHYGCVSGDPNIENAVRRPAVSVDLLHVVERILLAKSYKNPPLM